MGKRLRTKTEELVREYIATTEQRFRRLSAEQEAEIVLRWQQGDMRALNVLICCHLRHVIYLARRSAGSWYTRDSYWPGLRELIGAGNYGLLLAAKRFRSSEGVRFVTASKHSIRKELIRQAKFDRERAITRPYDEKPFAGPLLDGLRGTTDDEIEIPDGEVHARRSLCIIPNDDGDQPDGRSFSGVLAAGLAKLNDVSADTPSTTFQIWADVKRRRYERPALPTLLKVIADDNGVSPARLTQVAFDKTGKKIHAAVMSKAGERRVTPFPKWHDTDKWCDLPKGRREASMADWLGSSDYNLKRVEAAIDSDSELPPELQITTPDGYSPAAHLAKLVAWRRAAAEQDREQKERLERYLERKSLEQRVTLTAKGYRAVRELDRQTEDATQASAGEHSSPTKRTRSVA